MTADPTSKCATYFHAHSPLKPPYKEQDLNVHLTGVTKQVLNVHLTGVTKQDLNVHLTGVTKQSKCTFNRGYQTRSKCTFNRGYQTRSKCTFNKGYQSVSRETNACYKVESLSNGTLRQLVIISVQRNIDWNSECTLTLRLLMSYIYGAPSKARNANVIYIWTYVWQR